MKLDIDQFSPMQDTGTDKATQQPAFISSMNNCYVNSGNIVPIKLPKGSVPDSWKVVKEYHTADYVICDVVSSKTTGAFTVLYNKKTGGWEPAAPALGGIDYKGPRTYPEITGEILLSNLLSGLKKSNFSETTFAASPAKCAISDDGMYCLYLVAGTYPTMSKDGGISFSALSYNSGSLGAIIDFAYIKSFERIWLLSSSTLWESNNYGTTWAIKLTGSFQKISWLVTGKLYIQTSITTGIIYDISTGATSTPSKQGRAVENISNGNIDTRGIGALIENDVVQRYDGASWTASVLKCDPIWSDEPIGSKKWAYAKARTGEKWYDETNTEVKPLSGRIVYLCRTYGVQVEKAGDFYNVYKNGILAASLSAVDQNRFNADGSSVDDYVKDESDIIGVSGAGEYLIFRSFYFFSYAKAAEMASTIGLSQPIRMQACGIKKVNLGSYFGKISIVVDNGTSATSSFNAGLNPRERVRTNPAARYVAVPVTDMTAGLLTPMLTMYGFFDSLSDTSSTKINAVPCSGCDYYLKANMFCKIGEGDFRSTISLTNDNYIIGAGGGTTYSGKIIKVDIASLGKAGVGRNTGSVTVIGNDEWGSHPNKDWRGMVSAFSGKVAYNITEEIIGSDTAPPTGSLPFYFINTGKYIPSVSFPGERIKLYASFGVYGAELFPLITSPTKVVTKGDDSIFFSSAEGLFAIYPNNGRNVVELVSSEGNLNFSVYIDSSGSVQEASIAFSDSTGVQMRNLISGTTELLKVGAAGAQIHITKGYGIVLNGNINLIGCSVSPDGTVIEVSPSLTESGALSLGNDVRESPYIITMNRKMEFITSIIDTDTAEETLVFMDQSGMLYKKKQGKYSVPFFEKEALPGIRPELTYFPAFCTMFNARFAMAGGFLLTGEDQVVNGGMTTMSGWQSNGASTDGTKMTLTPSPMSFITQRATKDCIVVAHVNDPSFVSDIDKAAVIKIGTGSYIIAYTTPTKDITVRAKENFKGADLIVSAVHAYTIERSDTSVYISDQVNYEEFYSGTGSIQKLPALGIEFNGIIPIGESLYVIRDGSTARISETGSASNPFAVVEEFVRQGGQYPFKCLQTFAVVRKATAKGEDSADVLLFSGTDYLKMNTVWNSPFDRPFSFSQIYGAQLNGMTILSQNQRAVVLGDSGRSLSIETHQEVEKIGELEMGGILSGDINEDVFVEQSKNYDVTIAFTAGQPNQRKRLRKVKVLPEQKCRISVGSILSTPANGAAAFNATGRDINVVVDIDADSYIEGMQFEADVIMPTDRR